MNFAQLFDRLMGTPFIPVLAFSPALVTLVVCLGAIFGAFTGSVVGLVFPDTLAMLSQALGIEAAPYQLGAMFGFVGGFFRSNTTVQNH